MNKQNKFATVIMTALLVLLMAGSAMCATYDSSVTLENKNSQWNVIEDGFSATVEYNASGDVFAWRAYGTVPNFSPPNSDPNGNPHDYALIYYADEDNRFINWGGNNPGALLGVFPVSNSVGNIGSFDTGDMVTELDINMPESPDYNIDPFPWDEYCSEGTDNFESCCGAKLWIVPCDDYDAPEMDAWNPEDYLFETNFIWYDNTDYNLDPGMREPASEYGNYQAGDTVNITVKVCDYDGVGDLEDMEVTADFTEHGIEEVVLLELDEVLNCICATYIGSVVITEAGEICGEVVATDPSGGYSDNYVCFNVTPGECIMVIEGPVKAFTHGIVYLDVYCEDEYGNAISCCSDFASSITGDASHYADWNDSSCSGSIQVVDYGNAGEVTVKACCICGGERVQDTHTITFMNQIDGLDLTAEPEFIYNISTCGEDVDCTDISAHLVDEYGDPVPMPGIVVTFTINGGTGVDEVTDDNGTAAFRVCMNSTYSDPISVKAEVRCITETIDIDIIEPVLASVEIVDVTSPVVCGDEQMLTYVCYTNHSTEMCCPDVMWTTDALGVVNYTDWFTAIDSGTAVVELNISGVTDTVEIVINCSMNCADIPQGCVCTPQPFVVTSGSVTLSGNFSEVGVCTITGWACVKAIGDPIPAWDNDTRGAIVNVSEDRTEDVMLNLSGDGDTWKYNETTGNWSKHADGSVSEVSNGTYALVTPAVITDTCEGVTCDGTICDGVDMYNMTCDDGVCIQYMLIEANCIECGYDPCDGVICDGTVCVGIDLWSEVCEDGVCVPDALIEANCAGCGYDPCDGVVCDDIICYDGNCYNMTCDDGTCIRNMMVEECSGTKCVGVDLYNTTCEDGECVAYMLIEANCAECDYIPPTPAPTRRSSRGGDGTYPPGWPNGATNGTGDDTYDNESEDNETAVETPTPVVTPTVEETPIVEETPVEEETDDEGGISWMWLLIVLAVAAVVIGAYLVTKNNGDEDPTSGRGE